MNYLVQWAHLYVVHFGFWVTFGFAMSIYKQGLPELKVLPNMLKVAVILAAILSAFSSHSHHYLSHIVPDAKILHENEDGN